MRVVLCCDAGPEVGARHVLRSLAIAEELATRGADIVFVCDAASSPWAQAQIEARGMEVVEPAASDDALVWILDRIAADAVVFDSPRLPGAAYTAVRRTGRPTLAVIDGDHAAGRGGVEADVLVDPSLGADETRPRAPRGSTLLAGAEFALLRNDVLADRPIGPPRHRDVEVPRVVVVLDDADAVEAGPILAQMLTGTGRPFEATFVAQSPQARAAVSAVRPAPRQRIDAVESGWRLHRRVARADALLATAAPSTYEWLCQGAATGLVWSDDGDVELYRRLMMRRAVIGLGALANLRTDLAPGVEKASRLLSDARERTRLADAGWHLVDGMGRARVVDALVARIEDRRRILPEGR